MSEPLGMIHRFIEGSTPDTLLLLHGTGGNENDLLDLGRDLDPDANLLSPRGKVLENGMPRFFRRLTIGVFDQQDLVARTHELASFVRETAQTYQLDPARITAVGYSNGGNIAGSLLLLHPGLLRAAALLHAVPPFVAPEGVDLSGTEVFQTAGRHDQHVTGDQAERLTQMLEKFGARVRMEWQPGGHELTWDELHALSDWWSLVKELIRR